MTARKIKTTQGVLTTATLRRIVAAAAVLCSIAIVAAAQVPSRAATVRIGEKLSYSVSFEKFGNAGYLETEVVSQGKLGGKDVVELRGRAKTYELVSAAFSLLDEDRTVFVTPDSLLPVLIRRNLNDGVSPKVVESNYLGAPTSNFDILSLIFKLRDAGGIGTYNMSENGEDLIVTALAGKSERVKTDVGDFDTVISQIQSPYFDARGIRSLAINFSTDEFRVPVLIRFRTAKGDYRAELAGVQVNVPPSPPIAKPTPVATPVPAATPKPVATPTPYDANRPLLPELAFVLGETLEYKVTSGGKPTAQLTLQAKERTLFNTADSLLLSAKITGVEQGNQTFALGDGLTVRVDPDTLVPIQYDAKFGLALSTLTQTAKFDAKTGAILFGGTNAVDAPIGTHSILSLLYAMRSFNLKPSKDLTNPVNDTRVAVFWSDRPLIFTLRPGSTDVITMGDEKVPVQLISIITGDMQLDALNLKVWLSADGRRLPLRISAGTFQADLTRLTLVRPN